MYVKILLAGLLLDSIGGLDYERYYGKSTHTLLTSFGRMEDGLSPLKIILDGLDKNVTTNNTCSSDLLKFRTSLGNMEPWAVQMADSFGGQLPGALSGNLINLGSYDECLTIEKSVLTSKYCWLKIFLRGGTHQNSSFIPHNAPIHFALCIPNTCEPQDIERLVQPITETNVSIAVTCQETSPSWGPWEIFGAIFFSVLLLATAFSTAYDKFFSDDYEGYNGLWCSFSLIRNTKLLTANQSNKFSCIDGLRVLSQFAVIMYHAWRDDIKNEVPVYNKFALNKFIRSWEGVPIVTTSFCVDTFTVIGGFLVMYSIISKEGKKIVMSQHLFTRFMRMYPPYFIGLVLMLTLAGMICDGPLCEAVIYKRQDMCKEVWWTNVLCIQNIYPGLTKACMSHTWYVAADLQLFMFLSPLIIIGLHESKLITMWTIIGAICSAIAIVFSLTVAKDLKTETLLFDRGSDAQIYYDTLYTQPYSRLAPWGIGLLFGIVMHHHKRNKITLKKEHILAAWTICGIVMTSVIFADLPFQQDDYEYSGIEAALYNSLSRPLWSLGVCWIIFACSTGYAGPINDLLSCQLFQLLGQLSYSAYLIHKLVVNLYFSSLRASIYISPLQQVTLIFGLIAQSFLAAFFFYLIAEMPFVHIAKFLLRGGSPRSRQELTVVGREQEPQDSRATGCDTLELGHSRNSQSY